MSLLILNRPRSVGALASPFPSPPPFNAVAEDEEASAVVVKGLMVGGVVVAEEVAINSAPQLVLTSPKVTEVLIQEMQMRRPILLRASCRQWCRRLR